MLNTASIVVQVEDSGVDWPAIIASISAGVAAVAGIGGTLWQARRTWSHDDERAKIAEKRRIYANSLATFNTAWGAAIRMVANKGHPAEANTTREYDIALAAGITALTELVLIAPHNVAELAGQMLTHINGYSASESDALATSASDLTEAMRIDLGGPRYTTDSIATVPQGAFVKSDD